MMIGISNSVSTRNQLSTIQVSCTHTIRLVKIALLFFTACFRIRFEAVLEQLVWSIVTFWSQKKSTRYFRRAKNFSGASKNKNFPSSDDAFSAIRAGSRSRVDFWTKNEWKIDKIWKSLFEFFGVSSPLSPNLATLTKHHYLRYFKHFSIFAFLRCFWKSVTENR